ncbi:DnaJ sub B member 13, partial [Nowakowskiella sp. JEL0078]
MEPKNVDLTIPGAPFDYYKTLSIDRSADDALIKKAYRRMALKFHPEKNEEDGSSEIFIKIAEAYDVLSDAQKRAIYDQYGYEGLLKGVPPREGVEIAIEKTGRQFGEKLGGMYGMNKETRIGKPMIGGSGLPFGPTQDPAIEHEILVTLEELYLGTVKKMKLFRKVLKDDNMTTSEQDKILTIEIQPGWKEGTRISFIKEGDQGPNTIPADIIFIIKQKPHQYFERRGDDLVYKTDISLLQALTGNIVDIIMLDGRHLKIPVNEVVRPDFLKEVPGEGMPIWKANSDTIMKGCLLIGFNIKFPTYLKNEQKIILRKAL